MTRPAYLASITGRSAPPLDLLTALLRFNRDHQEEFRRQSRDPVGQAGLSRAREYVASRLEHTDTFERIEVDPLVGWVGESAELSDVMAARALAEALDVVVGRELADQYADRGPHDLEVDEVFPRYAEPIFDLVGRSNITSHPDLHGAVAPVRADRRRVLATREPDRLSHVALVPPLAGFRVRYEPCPPVLVRLVDGITLTGLFPHGRLEELQWAQEQIEGQSYFHSVRPRNATTEADEALLTAAADVGASIAVFPELSGTESDVLARIQQAHALSLGLTVAGSYHRPDEQGTSTYVNEALTRLRGTDTYRHHKFNPFVHPLLGTELLAYRRQVTLIASAGWTVATLICKDLIEPSVVGILERLGVSLVLVTSFSDRTQELESQARHMATTAQTMVVIVNASTEHADAFCASMILAVPDRRRIVQRLGRSGVRFPAVGRMQFEPARSRIPPDWQRIERPPADSADG
ncbi:MAG: hypothetical protein AAF602_26940 [Myxococcota bacterium]